MFYETSNSLKTKKDYEVLLQELKAYIALDNSSESTYYKQDIQYIQEILNNWDKNNKHYIKKQKSKFKLNKHQRNKISQDKLYKLYKYAPYIVNIKKDENNQKYLQKICFNHNQNNRANCFKKLSNKKIRKYKHKLKRSNYKKIYDYWWEVL